MTVALGRRSLLAIAAALALALVAAMMVSVTAAQADPPLPKRAYCHATGSAQNPFVLVVVQKPIQEIAHENHPDDVKLGRVASKAEARELFEERCAGEGTTGTSTTTTGTTTTGTGTTTTGTTTTGTGTTTTGTTTTGTGTTTTTGTGTTTTGTGTTTTGTGTTTTGTGTTTTGTGTTTTTGAAAAQYQYSASATAAASLPPTGGSSPLLPIGALALLAGGGIAMLVAVRRGMIG